MDILDLKENQESRGSMDFQDYQVQIRYLVVFKGPIAWSLYVSSSNPFW